MDGTELTELIDQRWSVLRQLLEISDRQIAAIEAGRMSELMRLLADKQTPLNRLAGNIASGRDATMTIPPPEGGPARKREAMPPAAKRMRTNASAIAGNRSGV